VGILMGLGAVYIARVLPLRLQLRRALAASAKEDRSGISPPDD
jgi:hypothetical protein